MVVVIGGARSEIIVAPNGWVAEIVSQRAFDGFDQYEYHIWTSQKSKAAGDQPHILNNDKSQIREDAQEIILGATGRPLWQPDRLVAAVEITDFSEFERTQHLKYKPETVASKLEWETLGGHKVAPLVFPTYYGEDEALDGQFVRRTFKVNLEALRAELILAFIERAVRNGYVGDVRGTTLNLTVAASLDDSRHLDVSDWSGTSGFNWIGNNSAQPAEHQSRFTSVTVPAGATINSAVYTAQAISSLSGATVNVTLKFEAADNPGQVSSSADFLARTLGSTGTAWNAVASTTANADFAAPDLTASLQQVIDRGGWASGQAINLFAKNNASTSGANRDAKSYNNSTSLCGRLAIDYTAGSAAPRKPQLVRQAVMRAGVR